jgi:hypothetical protein
LFSQEDNKAYEIGIDKFWIHLKFLNKSTEERDGNYFIKVSEPVISFMNLVAGNVAMNVIGGDEADLNNNPLVRQIMTQESENDLSINDLEETLNRMLDGESNLPMYYVCRLSVEKLEQTTILDFKYFRIFSLTGFVYPEMYTDKWLHENLKYMMFSFPTKNLSFCTALPYIAFEKRLKLNDVQEAAIALNIQQDQPFNILDIILVNNNIVVYLYENLITTTSRKTKLSKKNLDEILENPSAENHMIIGAIVDNLESFYRFTPNIRNSNEVRKITLDNFKILGNLLYGNDCTASFMEFMGRLNDFTLKYK